MEETLKLIQSVDPKQAGEIKGLMKETKGGVRYLVSLPPEELRQILLKQILERGAKF